MLTSDQINALGRKSTRGLKRLDVGIADGLSFKSQLGTTNYNTVSKRFKLPSIRLLQKKTEHIKFRTGMLQEVITPLREVVPTLREEERDCHICYDEISIEPNGKLYDPSTKRPIGKCTLPGHIGIAKKSVVVMVAGISSRWKLPVAYHFSGNRDKDLHRDHAARCFKVLLFEIIRQLEIVGLRVNSMSSDMGADNRALWRVLKIVGKRSGKLVTSTSHPMSIERQLHLLPEVPHLFKNIVLMLESNKYIVLPDYIVQDHNLSSNIAQWSHLKELMLHEKQFELKVAYRLTEEKFEKGHFEKMQVGRAASFFCRPTVVALQLLAKKLDKPEYNTTAWFIGLVVRWFELAASRCVGTAFSHRNKEAYQQAVGHLQLTSDVFQRMIVGPKQEWKPSQEGMLIANKTLLNLQEYFLNERGYKFLLTSRFNQDCLENLFSQIRRRQAVPNALMFKNILKEITISGKSFKPPRGHGYSYDDGHFLLNLLQQKENEPEAETPADDTVISCPAVTDEDVHFTIDDWELIALYDICGSAVHKTLLKHNMKKTCKCIAPLVMQDQSHHPCSGATLLKNYKDGALIEASDDCFMALVKAEIVFRILRDQLLSLNLDVLDTLLKNSAYVMANIERSPCHEDLPEKLLKKYFEMRLKQYSLKGKKDLASEIYSSRSHAKKAFTTNVNISY